MKLRAATFVAASVLAFAGLVATAQAAEAVAASWAVRAPAQDKLDYRGAVNFDAAGTGSGTMMYPAPGVVGLFAAVLTHAVIVNSIRSNQKTQAQIEADKVLAPYQDSLAVDSPRALYERALGKAGASSPAAMVEAKATFADGWLVEAIPVFILTQDQRALILENTVAVFAAASPMTPVYQNVVRVVSPAEPDGDLVQRWNAERGALLQERSADLLARSFAIAVGAAAAAPSLPASPGAAAAEPPAGPQRTFRYPEGGRERMERAQLVSRTCDRLLVRTLRGWLMSIPARPEDAALPECPSAPATATVAAVEPSASAPAAAAPDVAGSGVASLR